MPILSDSIIWSYLIWLVSVVWFWIYHFAKDIAQWLSGNGIPYVRTPKEKIEALINSIELRSWDIFIDVGCWDGAILEAIEEKFPKAHIIGYEKSLRPFQEAMNRKKKNRHKYEVLHEDFFDADISNAKVIYSYMISYIMRRIWKKIQSECQPGTIFVSSSFPVPNIHPKEKILTAKGGILYIYEVKSHEKK